VSHCCKLSPFQAHWGRWHCTLFLRPACLFTAHVGSWPLPLFCRVFLLLPLLQAFPFWLLGRCLRSCLLQLACLFTVPWGISCPLLFSTQGTLPSSLRVFFVVIAYYSVSLFSLGGGQSVQGAMLIWPRVVCGSTACCLAHLVVCVFPSCLGTAIWRWHGSPPGFSV
jgi:hypothetical protein